MWQKYILQSVEHLSLVLALAGTAFMFVWEWTGKVDTDWKLSGVVALLGLFILHTVAERYRRHKELRDSIIKRGEQAEKRHSQLLEGLASLQGVPEVEHFYRSVNADEPRAPQFADYAQKANAETFAIGPSLNLFRDFETLLLSSSKPGRKVKLMIMRRNTSERPNPSVSAMQAYANKPGEERLVRDLENSYEAFMRWVNDNPGRVELRRCDLIPLTLHIVDGATEDGRMLVNLFLYGVGGPSRPCFELTRRGQPYLFTLFYDAFSRMCEAAEYYDASSKTWKEAKKV